MDNILEVFVIEDDVETQVEPKTVRDLLPQFYPVSEEKFKSESEDEKTSNYQSLNILNYLQQTDDIIISSGENDGTISNSQHLIKHTKRKLKYEDGTPKKRLYSQRYRKEWENKLEYRPWLSESVLGNLYFYCKFCKDNNKCGRAEIEKHMKSLKHFRNSKYPQFLVQSRFTFKGLLCSVFTPFMNKDKEVNYKVIHSYAKFLSSHGIKGILINDVLGEGMSLTVEERMKVTEEWVKVCEKTKQHLMVQIGGAALKDVQEMIRHAERKRVSSVVILPDLYNKPKDHYDLMRYIKLVSDAADTIPLLYHHNPTYTGVNIDISKLLSDIIGEVKLFVGVIFSDSDLKSAISALQVQEDKFNIIIGSEEIILGSAVSGFQSFLSASLNMFPTFARNILEHVKSHDIEEARKNQNELKCLLDTISRHGDWLPAIKAAMNISTPIDVGLVREPLVPIWQDKVNKMKIDLNQQNFSKIKREFMNKN